MDFTCLTCQVEQVRQRTPYQKLQSNFTEIFTGHGPFNQHLNKFHCFSSKLCECGEVGTLDNTFYLCNKTEAWYLRYHTSPTKYWLIRVLSEPTMLAKLMIIYNYLIFISPQTTQRSVFLSCSRGSRVFPSYQLHVVNRKVSQQAYHQNMEHFNFLSSFFCRERTVCAVAAEFSLQYFFLFSSLKALKTSIKATGKGTIRDIHDFLFREVPFRHSKLQKLW